MVQTESQGQVPAFVQEVIDDLLPLIQQVELGRYAVGMSGSLTKRVWDERSDIDLRLYHEQPMEQPGPEDPRWLPYFARIAWWAERGVTIDGLWARTIDEVDASVAAWLSGDHRPDPIVWSVWGYHPLPDLSQQLAVDDPYGIIAGWRAQLTTYPPILKERLLAHHLESLHYWRDDYHYANKVVREDVVFLAGLSTRLVHDVIQVIFALNETFFAGDGNNLRLIEGFAIAPDDAANRITAILYPPTGIDGIEAQRAQIIALIDDLDVLATDPSARSGHSRFA